MTDICRAFAGLSIVGAEALHFNDACMLTSDEVLELHDLPRRIAVKGLGSVGL